jgi:hypothetical protein
MTRLQGLPYCATDHQLLLLFLDTNFQDVYKVLEVCVTELFCEPAVSAQLQEHAAHTIAYQSQGYPTPLMQSEVVHKGPKASPNALSSVKIPFPRHEWSSIIR